MINHTRLFMTAGTLVGLVACGAGGGGTAASTTATDLSSGKLVLDVPARSAADGKHRAFLSPSADSVAIVVSGIASTVVGDVSATSPDCTVASGARTCAIPVAAPVGNDTFTVTLYAGPNATGAVLGSGTITKGISSGTPFAITIDVHGSAASVTLSAAKSRFTAGVPATAQLFVSALDAGGNTISGPYQTPIALSNSDTTGTFTISPTSVASSTTMVTIAYSGGTGATTATITASGANLAATSLSTQIVTAANAPFSLVPNAVSLLADNISTNVTIDDPSPYAGSYAISIANASFASATIAGKTITVTSISPGVTSLTVSAGDGRSVTIPVTVTTTSLPVQ